MKLFDGCCIGPFNYQRKGHANDVKKNIQIENKSISYLLNTACTIITDLNLS